jgi:uncharacterized membrane protein
MCIRSYTAASAALTLVLSFGLTAVAWAESWQVCNRTPDNMTVAIAYSNSFGQIITEGWWTIRACGGCATVVGSEKARALPDKRNAYLYAHVGSTATIRGDESFCVGDSEFTINSSASPGCPHRRPFKAESINLNRDHTTNITGRGVSGNVCID